MILSRTGTNGAQGYAILRRGQFATPFAADRKTADGASPFPAIGRRV